MHTTRSRTSAAKVISRRDHLGRVARSDHHDPPGTGIHIVPRPENPVEPEAEPRPDQQHKLKERAHHVVESSRPFWQSIVLKSDLPAARKMR